MLGLRSTQRGITAGSAPRQRSVRVLAAAQQPANVWQRAAGAVRLFQQRAACAAGSADAQEALKRDIKQSGASMAGVVLPLAAASLQQGTSATAEIYWGLAKAVDVYLIILTVRVLLSWFRNISWYNEPFNTLRQLTDPFLNVFRGIIPPIGGIDLSPMLGFFGLQFLRNVLMGMVSGALV